MAPPTMIKVWSASVYITAAKPPKHACMYRHTHTYTHKKKISYCISKIGGTLPTSYSLQSVWKICAISWSVQLLFIHISMKAVHYLGASNVCFAPSHIVTGVGFNVKATFFLHMKQLTLLAPHSTLA